MRLEAFATTGVVILMKTAGVQQHSSTSLNECCSIKGFPCSHHTVARVCVRQSIECHDCLSEVSPFQHPYKSVGAALEPLRDALAMLELPCLITKNAAFS